MRIIYCCHGRAAFTNKFHISNCFEPSSVKENRLKMQFYRTVERSTLPSHKSKDVINPNLDSNPNLREGWVGHFPHNKDMVSFGRSGAKNGIFWRVTVTPPKLCLLLELFIVRRINRETKKLFLPFIEL